MKKSIKQSIKPTLDLKLSNISVKNEIIIKPTIEMEKRVMKLNAVLFNPCFFNTYLEAKKWNAHRQALQKTVVIAAATLPNIGRKRMLSRTFKTAEIVVATITVFVEEK